MEPQKQTELLSRITTRDGMKGGKPTIRGLRFPVKDVLELMASGMTAEQLLDEHPILEKDDIAAALLYASLKVDNCISLPAA